MELSFLLLPGENPYKVDGEQIKQRAKLLQRYLKDEQKELQALYALQALMVQMEQPASKLTFGLVVADSRSPLDCMECYYFFIFSAENHKQTWIPSSSFCAPPIRFAEDVL